MIIDRLENAPRYYALHPAFAEAFEYLRALTGPLEAGRHEIDGDRLFVMAANGTGRGRDDMLIEAHQKYIDIHFTIDGVEELGWKAIQRCEQRKTEYDEAGDCELFTDQPDSINVLPPGTFGIYFPEDAHAPMIGQGEVHKAVVKVAV